MYNLEDHRVCCGTTSLTNPIITLIKSHQLVSLIMSITNTAAIVLPKRKGTTHQASAIHKELQATEEFWEGKKYTP